MAVPRQKAVPTMLPAVPPPGQAVERVPQPHPVIFQPSIRTAMMQIRQRLTQNLPTRDPRPAVQQIVEMGVLTIIALVVIRTAGRRITVEPQLRAVTRGVVILRDVMQRLSAGQWRRVELLEYLQEARVQLLISQKTGLGPVRVLLVAILQLVLEVPKGACEEEEGN